MKKSTHIIVITGSIPPDICGVGDYTYNLCNADHVDLQDITFQQFYWKDWSLRGGIQALNALAKANPDILIMQYPTQGYGWSLMPHVISAYFSIMKNSKFVAVLHECSRLTLKARAAAWIILLMSNYLIFTNYYEQNRLSFMLRVFRKKTGVVPIKSNIPFVHEIKFFSERFIDVIYFGHVRPQKGIEEFIEIVRTMRNGHGKQKVIWFVGQIPTEFGAYATEVVQELQSLNVEVVNDADNDRVSYLLNDSKFALLPFPDGLSERRGTALAALGNGAVLISYFGKHTTPELCEAAIDLSTANTNLSAFIDNLNEEFLAKKQLIGAEVARKNFPANWNSVRTAYLEFIKNADT